MKKSLVNIGLLGFGTIGSGVVKVLQEKAKLFEEHLGLKLILKKIVDKDITTKRDVEVDPSILSTNAEDILKDTEVDVVIELIGGYEPARTFILTALRQGKSVVTANKALLAKYWQEIFLTANESGTKVYFEASVGGGIPIISSIREGLVANEIKAIFGIINGTCNYILTKMEEEDKEFNQALKEAKNSGYAEANPTLDIEGEDTSHKLAILASLAFDQWVSDEKIYTEGITKITKKDILYAKELGYAIKLLGIAKVVKDEIEVRVHPTMIPKFHLLSAVKGVYNAIYIVGDLTGALIFYGQGAGKLPTSSAVISDLINLIHQLDNKENLYPIPADKLKIRNMEEVKSKYYIRFSALDKPGVLAAISGILGEYKISIASVIQKERGEVVPIIMLTHEAKEGNLKNALKKIDKLDTIKDKSLVIRVEEME
ncbi:MAG: homoserine dehydrogenase [bacterium]